MEDTPPQKLDSSSQQARYVSQKFVAVLGDSHHCCAMVQHAGDLLMSRAEETLSSARFLRRQNMDWVNVFYLSGLSVEHALWAVRCRNARLTEADYKACPGHDLRRLAIHAGLSCALRDQKQKSKGFRSFWQTVSDWDSNARYRRVSQADAKDFFLAVENTSNGVMRWLRDHYLTLP